MSPKAIEWHRGYYGVPVMVALGDLLDVSLNHWARVPPRVAWSPANNGVVFRAKQ